MPKQANLLTVSATTLINDILIPYDALALIETVSLYQVIPGFEDTMLYDPWPIILALLPHTKSKIIDICLPFESAGLDSPSTKLLARYILFREKLVGIRVRTGNQWPRFKCHHQQIIHVLMRFYRERGFMDETVLVGDFFLVLNNAKIALLFQSQIAKDDNILKSHYGEGCQVYSVVVDIPMQTDHPSINRLKDFSEKRRVGLIYCGCKLVQNPNKVYYTNAWIKQGRVELTQTKFQLTKNANLVLTINIDQANLAKYNYREQLNERLMKDNQIYFNKNILNAKLVSEGYQKSSETMLDESKCFGEVLTPQDVNILYIWYLYKAINRKSPFVLALPLTAKTKQFKQDIINLAYKSELAPDEVVKVFQTNNESDPFSADLKELKVYPSIETLVKDSDSKVAVYVENLRDLPLLKRAMLTCDKIIIVEPLFSISDGGVKDNRTQEQRKLEKICAVIVENRVKSLQQIYDLFMQYNLSREELMIALTKIIPQKIKKNVKMIPLQLFLINTTEKQILQLMGEAEVRKKQTKIIDLEKPDLNDYRRKVEAARLIKDASAINVKCHRCLKEFDLSLCYLCGKCKQRLCYSCLDHMTNKVLNNLDDYKCVICAGACKCKRCTRGPIKPPLVSQQSREKEQIAAIAAKDCICDTVSYINIECTKCYDHYCYFCLLSTDPFVGNKIKKWMCSSCIQKEQKQRQASQEKAIPTEKNSLGLVILPQPVPSSSQNQKIETETNKAESNRIVRLVRPTEQKESTVKRRPRDAVERQRSRDKISRIIRRKSSSDSQSSAFRKVRRVVHKQIKPIRLNSPKKVNSSSGSSGSSGSQSDSSGSSGSSFRSSHLNSSSLSSGSSSSGSSSSSRKSISRELGQTAADKKKVNNGTRLLSSPNKDVITSKKGLKLSIVRVERRKPDSDNESCASRSY